MKQQPPFFKPTHTFTSSTFHYEIRNFNKTLSRSAFTSYSNRKYFVFSSTRWNGCYSVIWTHNFCQRYLHDIVARPFKASFNSAYYFQQFPPAAVRFIGRLLIINCTKAISLRLTLFNPQNSPNRQQFADTFSPSKLFTINKNIFAQRKWRMRLKKRRLE